MRKWEKNKKNAIVLFLPICASTCDTILLQRWTWRVFIILSLVTGCCHRFGSWHVFWYHIRSKGGSRSTWLGKKGYIHIHHISSWYLFQDCKHCCLESHLIHTWRMRVSSYQEQLCSNEQLCFCSRKIVLLLGQSQEQRWLLQWKILHTSRLFNVPSRGPHFLPQPIFSLEYSRILVMEKNLSLGPE